MKTLPAPREQGHRYVRGYITPKGHHRWAGWEFSHGRYYRRATFDTYNDALPFIFYHDKETAR
jgi:hypothetical protein